MARLLEGRVAVVTGGGRGIGRGIALLLAEHGARVVVNDLGCGTDGIGASADPADGVVAQIRARGGTAVASYDTVATMQGGENIIKTAVDHFGRIDILVNNAGIMRDNMVFDMTEEEWDAVIAVHLKGTFACTRHASGLMRQQRSGRIINTTSTIGLYGLSGEANYGAAKDGIAAFTRQVARDLGRYGVTCNVVSPRADTRLRSRPRGPGVTQTEMALLGEAEDVAPFVVYLASDHAAHINGQVFFVADGQVAFIGHPIPVRTIHKQGMWTPEEIARVFPVTLGMDLVNPAPPQPAAPAST